MGRDIGDRHSGSSVAPDRYHRARRRVPDRPRLRRLLRLSRRPRAAAIQSVGRGARNGGHHGALRRARRHPGQRRRLCAVTAGLPVPATRHLLSAGCRPIAHLRPGRSIVTDATPALTQPPAPGSWLRPLAWLGGVVRARLRFVLSLMALTAGIVAEALLPRAWRRSARSEFW